MITDPEAARVLCFGDSNTFGVCLREPGVTGLAMSDPDYVRLPADRRWTGVQQRLLGERYDVLEEGLSGRTTDLDEDGRPGRNGRNYFVPCLQSHGPLDVIVVMLGTNDLKPMFGRTPRAIAEALHRYVDDVAANATDRHGEVPATILVGPTLVDDAAPTYRDLVGDAVADGLPARVRALATELRRVAAERGVPYADAAQVASPGGDGLHLSADSHARLAELLATMISEATGDRLDVR